jgi:hypothetical protein
MGVWWLHRGGARRKKKERKGVERKLWVGVKEFDQELQQQKCVEDFFLLERNFCNNC